MRSRNNSRRVLRFFCSNSTLANVGWCMVAPSLSGPRPMIASAHSLCELFRLSLVS